MSGAATTGATAAIDADITVESAEPYVRQLARQLEAFTTIEDVDDLDADQLGDLLLALSSAAERLDTEASHIARLAKTKGVGKHLGSASTGAWLAHRTNQPPAHVHRMIRRSETEHTFFKFYVAHSDGDITGYHVDHLDRLWRNHPHLRGLLHRDEQVLCDAACRLSPAEFGLVCRRWLSLADTDGSYDDHLNDRERRYLKQARDLDGNLHIAGRLDPITAEAFDTLLDRRCNELFDQDWAAAKAEAADGEVVTPDRLRRNHAQRRIDALMSLMIDGSSTPEGSQPPEPLIHFTIDANTFDQQLDQMLTSDLAPQCETGRGQPVPFRIMIQQLMTDRVRRVVYGAPNVIINAGAARRLFSPVQRELIAHRDRCCTFPGCHRPAAWCETDHIVAVTDGGLTDLANGQALCRHHHRLKTRGRFTSRRAPDGTVRFFLPNGHQIE